MDALFSKKECMIPPGTISDWLSLIAYLSYVIGLAVIGWMTNRNKKNLEKNTAITKDTKNAVNENNITVNGKWDEFKNEIREQFKIDREKEKRELASIKLKWSDVAIITDEQHSILLLINGVETIFGYTYKEIIGKSINMLVPLIDGHIGLMKSGEEIQLNIKSIPMTMWPDKVYIMFVMKVLNKEYINDRE